MSRQIVFDSFNVSEVIATIANHFHEKVCDDGVRHQVQLSPKHGSGQITMLDFRDGLSMLLFEVTLKEKLLLRFESRTENPLRMVFGVEEQITHIIKTEGFHNQIGSLAAAIVCGKAGSEQQLVIPAGQTVIFYLIDIDRREYHAKIDRAITVMPEQLRNVFLDLTGKLSFLYSGGYNLSISECIQNIRTNNFSGAVQRVYIESQTLEIMSMLIKQFIEDLDPSKKLKVLRKRDMELILEARKKLLVNLVNPPTIKELAQVMGTNENKLKAGFRLLYDTSINKLLQDERLTQAKLLMAEEVYPIKEIAKMVGYKHSAHFASKFKKRFGILPNTYLKSMLK